LSAPLPQTFDHHQITQREQAVQLCRVPGQSLVADLAETEPVLNDVESVVGIEIRRVQP